METPLARRLPRATNPKDRKPREQRENLTTSLAYLGLRCYCLVTKLCPTLCDPLDPFSVRSPRQEYCSKLPFPPPGDLPNPGTEPTSSALAGGFFTAEPPGKPNVLFTLLQNSGKLYNQMHQNHLITQA